MYLYERPFMPRPVARPDRWRWSHLCGLDDPPKRAGTLVLYAPPRDSIDKKSKRKWSFATSDGQTEYETALHTHLAKEKIVPATGTTYQPLTSSADIATLARDTFADLVLIVHSAKDGPAIAVKNDWIKDDVVGKVLAPLAYNKVTILGCDAVENEFAPRLAKRLPKGSTVVAHKGGAFKIKSFFEAHKTKAGVASLKRVSSNFSLKTFKGGQ